MSAAHQVHGAMDAPEYDDLIRAIVPDHHLLHRTIIDYLPDNAGTILELGCGTGILTQKVREACPGAEITAIDLSPEMLHLASAKPDLKMVRFLLQDLRDAWPPGHYDAILTSLCLHHIPGDDRILVARRAASVLSPGGRFICADVFRADHDWEEQMHRKIWRRGMERHGAPDDVIRTMIAQREKNMPEFSTCSWFQGMLVESGFSRATIPYTSGFFGVVAGEILGQAQDARKL